MTDAAVTVAIRIGIVSFWGAVLGGGLVLATWWWRTKR